MGDRLATIDMGRKLAAVPFGGSGSLSNTMWPGPWSTSIPSGILIHPAVWPQYIGRKLGAAVPPPRFGRGAGSPSNTMSPGSSIPSGICIHPAVWPQRTWAENWGTVTLLGELGPHRTQCGQGRGLPPCRIKFHLDPSNRLATMYQRYRQTGEDRQTTVR